MNIPGIFSLENLKFEYFTNVPIAFTEERIFRGLFCWGHLAYNLDLWVYQNVPNVATSGIKHMILNVLNSWSNSLSYSITNIKWMFILSLLIVICNLLMRTNSLEDEIVNWTIGSINYCYVTNQPKSQRLYTTNILSLIHFVSKEFRNVLALNCSCSQMAAMLEHSNLGDWSSWQLPGYRMPQSCALCEIVWASPQHGTLRAIGWFIWPQKSSGIRIASNKREMATDFMI